MSSDRLRIGIVGAGANTRLRHIPGFREIPGVEIVGVVNRSQESSQKVAQEFGIPKVFPSWQALVESPEVDAVMIGTWPNMHCEVTCAALAAGKHVLTEARLSRNLAEARQMLAASQAAPALVAQVVPSPFGLISGPTVQNLVKEHFIGDLREVVVLGADSVFWDYTKALHWRQDEELSGNNVLMLGILHETLMRWLPPVVQVYAQGEIFEPTRPQPEKSRYTDVTIPDCVHVLTEFEGGVRGLYHMSGTTLFGPGQQIHLYGSRGTIKVLFEKGQERLLIGRCTDSDLYEVQIPAEEQGRWQVEADFIASIRENKPVELTDFETGVAYMEFIEAVALSRQSNAPVSFPLPE